MFKGRLPGAENASGDVRGGACGPNGVKTINRGSLRVGAGGTLNAYVAGATGTSSLITADSATFESGAIISATINSLQGAEGSYVILSAANLVGAPVFADTRSEEHTSELQSLMRTSYADLCVKKNNYIAYRQMLYHK